MNKTKVKFTEKMTKEQEAKVPLYLKKWLDNGRKTGPLDRDKAIEAIKTIYTCAGMEPPKYFFFFPSPIQCQLANNVMRSKEFQSLLNVEQPLNLGSNLESNLESNLWSNLWSNLGSNLRSNLESNLWSNLGSNLRSNLESNLRSNLESNLWSNLGSNLRSNLESNLESNLWSNLESNLRDNLRSNLGSNLRSNLESNLGSNLESNLWSNLGFNLWSNLESNLESIKQEYNSTFYGNHWVGWVGFYDFILNELFEEQIPNHSSFINYLDALQNVHLFIPYKDIVFISDHPEKITLDANGRLHRETEPAMMYKDGYSLFYLNGIQVPKWAIETPKHEIEAKKVLELTNTEQRMALMRHVGLAYFLNALNAEVIDERNGYKLYYLTVENQKIGPYLFMKCPSTDRQFLEGVGDPDKHQFFDPTITDCDQALRWRRMKASQNFMNKINKIVFSA